MTRLPVENRGEHLLCLSIEPLAEDFWLRPGECLVIVPVGEARDPQFSLYVQPGHVTVWIYENGDPYQVLMEYEVLDAHGAEVACGHQRPTEAVATASGVFLLPDA